MAFVSGNGGTITLAGSPAVVVENSLWRLQKASNLGETTNSSTNGWQTFKGTTKTGTLTVEIPYDIDAPPDADGTLDDGDEFTATLKIGAGNKKYECVGVVENVEVVDDQKGDIVRAVVTARVWNIVGPTVIA
jgi:hypothetical protein